MALNAEKRVIEAEKRRQSAKLTAVQKSALELEVALGDFAKISCDPARDRGRSWLDEDSRPWLEDSIAELAGTWNGFTRDYPQVFEQDAGFLTDAEFLADVKNTDVVVHKLADAYRPMQTIPPPTADGDAALRELRRSATALAKRVNALTKRKLPEDAGLSKDAIQDRTGYRQIAGRWTDHFAVQAAKARWSLYDSAGAGLFVVPALEPTALEADRHRSEIFPWISLYALLEGSPDLLQGYPPEHVEQVRAAWAAARDAYLDHGAADRVQSFASAMRTFTARLRALATEIEPARAELPIIEHDKGLLAKTAYPRAIATDAEVFYNQFQPSFWSCYTSLAAAVILGLSFAVFRKPMFWLGTCTLIASAFLVAGGLALRSFITHWAPVTSMCETIVWVSMCVTLLTLWINFLPLLGPESKTAWAWTAIPGSWEDKRLPSPSGRGAGGEGIADEDDPTSLSPALSGHRAQHGRERGTMEVPARAVALTLRLLLFAVGLYVVGVIPALDKLVRHGGASYSEEYGLISLLPRVDIGSNMPGVSMTLVWLASMFVSAVVVWYAPRLVSAGLLAVGLSAASARRSEAAEKMEKIYSWRGVALAGAVASFLAGLAANYAPFPRDIEALMPVLRSNFWLGIHVLTITTSYAGTASAWVIGNLALGFYLFGSYVRPGAAWYRL